eukprot:1817577-Alexandrium_andersonii.AAC.1
MINPCASAALGRPSAGPLGEGWCARGLRREAMLARTLEAVWQPAPAEAIRKMIGNAQLGQHVLAAVTGATFSEARLEVRHRAATKLKL